MRYRISYENRKHKNLKTYHMKTEFFMNVAHVQKRNGKFLSSLHASLRRGEYIFGFVEPELIEGNGYEGRQTSKVLNNRRSYNLKVPIT